MLIAALTVLNIPVYLFLGWLAFDSKAAAAETLSDTIVAVIKMIVIPRIVRVLFDIDTEGSLGLLPIGAYLVACGFLVYGEYLLIVRLFG